MAVDIPPVTRASARARTDRALNRRAFLGLTAGALATAVCDASHTQAPAGPAPVPAPVLPAPGGLRVMTYNIHHAEGEDGRIDVARIGDVIRAQSADLVALQEVDRGTERTARRDLPAELAALTGMTCLFRNNHAFQGGEYGNAILTRLPVRRWTNTWLRMLRDGEQRGVLQAVVEAGGRELLFMATHIDHRPDDSERLANVAQFREILAGYGPIPAVFGGDFNDTPGSRTYAGLAEMFDDAWMQGGEGSGFTIPSRSPNRRIDYLWIRRGSPLRAIRAWVPATDASDHLPLVADLSWPA